MAPTWGISGPAFLGLWLVLAVVTLVLPHVARATAGRRPPGREPDLTLTPAQLGVLAGGEDRAAAASIAGLLESGRLRADDSRRLCTVVGPVRPEDDPQLSDLDVRVLRDATTPRAASALVATVRHAPEVGELGEQLVARGLLHDPAAVRRRLRRAWIPFGLVVVLGLARLAAGLGRGASVGFLMALLVVVGVVALVSRPRSLRVLTPRGQATLDAARASARQVRPPVAAGPPGVAPWLGAGALLVAVGGFAAFPDPALAALLVPPVAFGGGGGGGDVGSSCGGSSCGSSCGGGGCGGGGCGG
ncbi:TIGR04222 domain-containing membrane protein [Actinomycetospora soli]|uniref:TIGR04222 domain-containing membrane protein n=1 Tax=Actinomycetospora soli TaxID=2893887 RepID=UPI001E42A92E|nr:TIGR04222 domain-containing membrane protein [Actinomycetospora soli]MCD2190890.1 TIGR04222 domain-containing membrane protein [Actinomycetospora soli]